MQTSKGMAVIATSNALIRPARSSEYLDSGSAMSQRPNWGDGNGTVEDKGYKFPEFAYESIQQKISD